LLLALSGTKGDENGNSSTTKGLCLAVVAGVLAVVGLFFLFVLIGLLFVLSL
jgi:hypothetical protein